MQTRKYIDRVVQTSLTFAEIVESKFIDGGRANRRCLTDVYLLHSSLCDSTETGNVRACSLELGKGNGLVVIVKIIVGAEMLILSEGMVESNRELV